MEIFFLTESETRFDLDWGKLVPITDFEKTT